MTDKPSDSGARTIKLPSGEVREYHEREQGVTATKNGKPPAHDVIQINVPRWHIWRAWVVNVIGIVTAVGGVCWAILAPYLRETIRQEVAPISSKVHDLTDEFDQHIKDELRANYVRREEVAKEVDEVMIEIRLLRDELAKDRRSRDRK